VLSAEIRVKVLYRTVIKLFETKLKSEKYIVFEIKLVDGKVILSRDEKLMLEVFPEFLQIGKYNLIQCSSVKFEIND
jgi:hypothetical protein